MLLSITCTEAPATDLGFLLHKHPDRVQSFAVSAGQAHVFYPEATEQRCTAVLLLEVDPIGLVRRHRGQRTGGQARGARTASPWPNTSTTVRMRPPRCWLWRWAKCSGPR